MSLWSKFGCFLTGWNSEVLEQCSQASRSQLNKYTSALLILILIWGVTGFCFAQRYIGLPVWGCCLVSLFFITIVIMIERQIILTTEKTTRMLLFRAVIALIMAIVGSTIFDQTMFGKDIDKEMATMIEKQVEVLTVQRVHTIDEKLASMRVETDSLTNVNAGLQADINKNPFIVQKSYTSSQQQIAMPDGTIQTVTNPSVTTNQVANPKQAIVDENNKVLALLREQSQDLTERKLKVEDEVRAECKANVGFLEELEAMYSIISTHRLAGVFYAVFFLLLMCLELFVVVSKTVDKECDYELTVKASQRVKIEQLNRVFGQAGMVTGS